MLRRTCTTCLAVALWLVIALLAGCDAPGVQQDAADVPSAVRSYNDALVVAFRQLDMNELNQVATHDQAEIEYSLMAALGEGRTQMLATLVSIDFGEVTFSEKGIATVATTEVWDYEHVSLDTSETIRIEQGVTYHLRYDLVLEDGRWLVASVTSVDDENPGVAAGSGP